MDNIALRAEGFGRKYGRGSPWAVRNVDLRIHRGSITALVGPNGAGKSTLIRSWVGFERPDEGRVFVGEIDVRRDRAAAIARLGYVPQGAILYRDLTVLDHFALAGVYRPTFDFDAARERVAAAGVGLGRRVGGLSGGEQAQVALALALGTRAPVLLLDEPLASLDPLARREFLTVLVDDVRTTGRTAVLSSHIVTDVQEACDRIVILSHGQLLLDAAVSSARETHRTLSGAHSGTQIVGRFNDAQGRPMTLVRSSDQALPEATLEEIVLGYMSSQRPVMS